MKPTILDWWSIETAPLDGRLVLLKTQVGIVSTWACIEQSTNDAKNDGCYD